MASYMILMRDWNGNDVGKVVDFISLEYARKENQVGSLTLILPRNLAMEPYYNKDLVLEIWRTVGVKTYLEGGTTWLVRKVELKTVTGTMKQWVLSAVDMNYLLSGYEIEYASESAQAKKTNAIDNMMKAIVRENMGSLATDTTRDLSAYLSVQANTTAAPSTTKAFARRNVLTVLQELATESFQRGTYLSFDVRYVSPYTWQFQTFVGQAGVNRNRASGNTVVVSESRSSLVGASLVWDWTNEVTVVNVGGTGQAAARAVVQVTDSANLRNTPFSRREVFHNATLAGTDTNALTAEGKAELMKTRGRLVLRGAIQDTDAMQYGIDYNFGDIVVAEHVGYSFDAHVDAIHVSVDKNGERVDNQLRGEL